VGRKTTKQNTAAIVTNNNDRDDRTVVDSQGAGEILGVSKSTMERLRHVGGGPPFFKIGHLVRYRVSALLAYRDEREHASTSEYMKKKAKAEPAAEQA